jgi:hypothetical protein
MILGLNIAVIFRHMWKVLYEIGLIPVVLVALFQMILPESHRYHINNGDDDKALEVLKRGLPDEEAELELKKLKYERKFFASKDVNYFVKISHLFGVFCKPFTIAIILAALNQFVGTSAFLYYGPEIIEMA